MNDGITPPENRAEFEHNIFLVIEDAQKKIDSGDKMAIGSLAAFTLPELKKLKPLPNGRVNLLTIDESLRLQANMLNQMSNWPSHMPQSDET